MKRKTFFIRSTGGIGDVILSTPTFGALKKKFPDCRIVVYCVVKVHFDVYRNNPHIDTLISPSVYANPVAYMKCHFKLAKFRQFEYARLVPSLSCEKSAAAIIADFFNINLEDPQLRLYLTPEEERWGKEKLAAYKNPVTMHITSKASANQHWPLRNWEELIRSLPEYTFIQLGLSNEEKVEGAVDLRGTTSFRETLSILNSSMSFVGVVSSLAHATNAFNIPGVVLYGPSGPKIWGHPNNINIYRNLPCAPCIDILQRSPCPYGKPCLTTITVEEVADALLSQLEHRISKRNENN